MRSERVKLIGRVKALFRSRRNSGVVTHSWYMFITKYERELSFKGQCNYPAPKSAERRSNKYLNKRKAK